MEIIAKEIALYISIIFTGLSAGLFFAWQISVIPGTKLVKDATYIETMQKINRAIINPPFMLIFLGTLIMQILSVYFYRDTTNTFWFILGATLLYGVGTVLLTGLGNVPLNDALDTLKLNELPADQITGERRGYESRWNRLHIIRTTFSILSFMMLLLTAFLTASPET